MVRRRQCSSERNRESKPAPDRGREGIHGGREREEESLRVQDAGNGYGCAEVRLTFFTPWACDTNWDIRTSRTAKNYATCCKCIQQRSQWRRQSLA